MVRLFGSTLLFATLVLAGCGVGDSGDDDQPPVPDAGDDPILCTATVTLSGTFTAVAALDPTGGCQPEGTWEITATVGSAGACTNVAIKPSYSYTLSGTGHNTRVTYNGTGSEFQGNVSANGDGKCSGFFEHIQPDGSNFDLIALHPLLPKPTDAVTELPISGGGDFQLWKRHP